MMGLAEELVIQQKFVGPAPTFAGSTIENKSCPLNAVVVIAELMAVIKVVVVYCPLGTVIVALVVLFVLESVNVLLPKVLDTL
ncbi:MAG: hypothetical protein EBZ77_17520 [Chitinophagia bacterium]|nr:hypothetical protein [Chitinophagia bacterium]